MAPSRTNPKTRRTRLDLSQKIEAARSLSSGIFAATVMKKFSISRRTATNLKKNASRIIELAEITSLSLQRKSLRPPAFPKIEDELLIFVNFARCCKLPITQAVLQHKALMIRDNLEKNIASNQILEHHKLSKFTASIGWVQNFIRRHALRSVGLHGEGGSASAAQVADKMSELKAKLRSYDVDCIYNVDETGLFYKLLPRRTYITEEENRKTIRGTKAMKSKDRITAYVCTNGDGSRKLPMAIIGKAKNPRCFRLGQPPVPYFSQKNSWSDTLTFKRWFYEVFLPFIRKATSRPCVLLMDNCGPHGTDLKDSRNQVTIMTLPPNCTAIHQPMDLGIIAAWKVRYCWMLLRKIVLDIETRQQRRESNRALIAGMKGIDEGHDPHLLDVSKMVEESWSNVSQSTIARCWVKANVLPLPHACDITSSEGKMSNTQNSEDVKAMTKMVEQLSISLDRRDPFYEQVFEPVNQEQVERWLTIEENSLVSEAVVEDALYFDELRAVESASSPEVESDDDGDTIMAEALPPEAEIIVKLRELEKWAFDSNLSDVSYSLRKARQGFLRAKRREVSGSTRQLLITEMLE